MTPDAKARGYKENRFSFNVKGGRCEACGGDGLLKIEMHFLPDIYVPCDVCKGARYNRETLDVRYKGKNIHEVLEMTVEEALGFFENHEPIVKKLQTLYDVGLDYIKLGQPSTQLSGGEAQRIKLATELSRRATGRTLYLLDEPTTGLHMADVQKLIDVLQRLVDAGNSVLVIEHNLDVIKTADYLIDLGPEGGDGGGTVVCQGTPEKVAKVPESYTDSSLRRSWPARQKNNLIKVPRQRLNAAGAAHCLAHSVGPFQAEHRACIRIYANLAHAAVAIMLVRGSRKDVENVSVQSRHTATRPDHGNRR